jgi:hypothetical protein
MEPDLADMTVKRTAILQEMMKASSMVDDLALMKAQS